MSIRKTLIFLGPDSPLGPLIAGALSGIIFLSPFVAAFIWIAFK